MVVERQTVTIDISASFTDPDGDALTHTAATSNAGVATVAVSGTELSVTGVAQGAAAVTVTASDPGGLSAYQSFAVEVAALAPTTVTVTPDTATLTAVDEMIQLYADVRDQLGRPMAGAAVVWSSSDTNVATVDTSGLVTAIANGTATVRARSGDVSDSASIVVSQTAATVEITPPTPTLATGDTVRLNRDGDRPQRTRGRRRGLHLDLRRSRRRLRGQAGPRARFGGGHGDHHGSR